MNADRINSNIDLANAKRFENVKLKSSTLAQTIDKIKTEYRDKHNGEEPNLSRLAEILTSENIEPPRGGSKWYAKTVQRIIEKSKINSLGPNRK